MLSTTMGLYLPATGPAAGEALSASITWREYTWALAAATEWGDGGRGGRPGARGMPGPGPGKGGPADPVPAARGRRRPRGGAAHRRLGLALLADGRDAAAARHLGIAYHLARRAARHAVGLTDVMQLQCEAAMLRLALIRLYMRLGQADRARALSREALAVL